MNGLTTSTAGFCLTPTNQLQFKVSQVTILLKQVLMPMTFLWRNRVTVVLGI